MYDLVDFSIKVRNLKCFYEVEQGFDRILPINIIIGRNNSGKSTLLDLIGYMVNGKIDAPNDQWHGDQKPQIIVEAPLYAEELKLVFLPNTKGGGITGDHWNFGKKYIGVRYKWNIFGPKRQSFIEIGDCKDGSRPLDSIGNSENYLEEIASRKANPFQEKIIKRIYAERNIMPEEDSEDLTVQGNGQGATNIIQAFLNRASLPRDLVKKRLLSDLNKIFSTDALFIDIVCQKIDTGAWEIFLEEEEKGLISLSQSGSGLKTIILVLIYMLLFPVQQSKKLGDYVFGFEELENNLHPALLRRLLTHIREASDEHNCIFFITTHSNVEIDLFSKDENAQIIHVTHNGSKAKCSTARTYIENRGVLDDLDVRASDLLQSNGIIWVEGPSDRIYINRWIELWTDGELKEGIHYQCVFYGGRLLSHLSGDEPESVEESVAILRVNSNAIIVIDSDKKEEKDKINKTKERIINEVEESNGMAWVTKGREIENYISASGLNRWLKIEEAKQVEQYEEFFGYLSEIPNTPDRNYSNKKPLFAETICPFLTKDSMHGVLDISLKLDEVCDAIRKWNDA